MTQLTDEQAERLKQITTRLENTRPEEPLPLQVLLDANYLLVLLDSDGQAAGIALINAEEIAKRLDYAAWKGFGQSESEFEKGYKDAMSAAAQAIRDTPVYSRSDAATRMREISARRR